HPAIAWMLVVAGVVGKLMTWLRVGPPDRFVRLAVDVLLRQGLAAPLTMAIKPRHRLLAAGAVENVIAENVGDRAANPIGEHGDADAAVGQHGHEGGPADPAAAMAHHALAAVALRAQAETVVRIANLAELGRCNVHTRRLQLSYQHGRQQPLAIE